MKRNRLSRHWLMVALMRKGDRRFKLQDQITKVKAALTGVPDSAARTILVEVLLDICEREDVHYFSSGCADYDVRIDMRPIEERHRDRN